MTLFAAPATLAAPLRSVVIDGASAYGAPELFASYRAQLGQEITRESLRAIAAAIVERYRDDGYARPEVRIEQPAGDDGILRLVIHEPRVTRVVVEGEPGRHRERIQRIGERVIASVPLRRDDIPRTVADLRRIPGLAVTPSTRRDQGQPNAYELVLDSEFSSLSGVVHANNRGTDQIGPYFLLGQLATNDLFGRDEKLGLLFSAAADTGEYRSAGLFYDAPVGGAGTRAMAMIFRSDSAPNEAPVNLSDEYRRERLVLSVSHPFAQTGTRSLVLSGSFEAEDLTVDRDGVDVRDDRLRVLEAGLRVGWSAGNATQVWSSLELRQGLDALGAKLRADDLAVDSREQAFTVAQLSAGSYTRLATVWSLRSDLYAQYSGDLLPDSERFKIGGERLGRGFEVAEIAGDRGLGGKLTLRRDLPGASGAFGRASVYGLYDIGAAWKVGAGGRESASTGGFGIALNGGRLSGYIEVVKPLSSADIEGKHSTAVFGEVSFSF